MTAAPAGAETPDCSRMEAWHSRAAGGLPAAWNGSVVVTRPARGAGATSRPGEGQVRPPVQAPRRSRGSECQRVVLWRGVAAKVATWSP